MDNPILIAFFCMGQSIRIQRANLLTVICTTHVERMLIVAHVLEGNVRNKDIALLHIFVASESIVARMSLRIHGICTI